MCQLCADSKIVHGNITVCLVIFWNLVRTPVESTDLNFVLHALRNALSHPFFLNQGFYYYYYTLFYFTCINDAHICRIVYYAL